MMKHRDAIDTALAWEVYSGSTIEIKVRPNSAKATVDGQCLHAVLARLQSAEEALSFYANEASCGDAGEVARSYLRGVGTGFGTPLATKPPSQTLDASRGPDDA
jgi:hypothetical protein